MTWLLRAQEFLGWAFLAYLTGWPVLVWLAKRLRPAPTSAPGAHLPEISPPAYGKFVREHLYLCLASVALTPLPWGAHLGIKWPSRIDWLGLCSFTLMCLLSLGLLRLPAFRNYVRGNLEAASSLIPRSPAELRGNLLLCILIGFTEELMYRGFLFARLRDTFPAIAPTWVILVSGTVFGVAHLYQGPWRALGLGLIGAALASLYHQSGSLLMPVIYHTLIDARAVGVGWWALPRWGQSRSGARPSPGER